jgi:hypothetical protein
MYVFLICHVRFYLSPQKYKKESTIIMQRLQNNSAFRTILSISHDEGASFPNLFLSLAIETDIQTM